MNFRHFQLSCNLFWRSGNFLDSIGPSRSLCRARSIQILFEGEGFASVLVKIWGVGGDCPSISDGPGAKTKPAQSSSTVALANMPLFFFFWPTKHYTFIHCCDFVLCTQFLWVMCLRKRNGRQRRNYYPMFWPHLLWKKK